MKRLAAAAVLASLAVFPVAVSGQEPLDGPLELRLTPRVGMLTPDGWLYVQYGRFGLGPIEWTEAAIQAGAVAGLAAKLQFGDSGVWLRGEVLRTLGGETVVTYAEAQEPVGFDPPTVARTSYDIPSTLTLATVDLVFPTRLRLPYGVQPYFTAGIGGKRYAFDRSAFGPLDELDEDLVFPSDGTDTVLNVGAGTTFSVLGLDLDVLVRDAINRYWDTLQHDVMVLLGMDFRVL